MPARVGTTISFFDPALAELVASAFDFVWIDLEHGSLSVRDVQHLAIAIQSTGARALVRVPSSEFDRLGTLLDAGVDGVVVPMTETPTQIEQVVQRMRYPPVGTRGLAPRRAAAYGRVAPILDAKAELVAQIETPTGVANAEAIAAVDGVDLLFVGTTDLKLTLPPGADVAEYVTSVQTRARDASKNWGLALAPGGPAYPTDDADMILLGSDVSLIARGIDREVTQLRDSLV
jgi:4-hydroxy-2-oxoheptanedioate aldolase